MDRPDCPGLYRIRMLTSNERAIIELARQGYGDKQICSMRNIAKGTLNSYWLRIRSKLDVVTRAEAVAMLVEWESRGNLQHAVDLERRLAEEITLRQAIEQELEASEQRFRRFFNSDHVGIVICKADGAVVEANSKYLEIIGRDQEEVEAGEVSWIDHIPEESIQEIMERVDSAFTSTREDPTIVDLAKLDGSRTTVKINGGVFDKSARLLYAFVEEVSPSGEATREARSRQCAKSSSTVGHWFACFETMRIIADPTAYMLWGQLTKHPKALTVDEWLENVDEQDRARIQGLWTSFADGELQYATSTVVVFENGRPARRIRAEGKVARSGDGTPTQAFGHVELLEEL
ncbi:MAG: PAS domain S-box protein [Fimbriimonadales bacterium]|nr:PAS domain S-box protein [Fimbriimonadales bacterium]